MITRVSSDIVRGMLVTLMNNCKWLGALEWPPAAFQETNESRSGEYMRQLVHWNNLGNGTAVQSNVISFSGLDHPSTVSALALFRSQTGGSMVAWGMLPKPIRVSSAGKVVVSKGTVSLRIA